MSAISQNTMEKSKKKPEETKAWTVADEANPLTPKATILN